jgi:ssDNA-specific exonuclease RecJ
MTDFFKQFASDEKMEIEGRWVDHDTETSFLVARSGNKHFNRLFSKLYQKNKVVLESKGDAAEAKSDEIMVETFAKTILLGWKGKVEFNGHDLPYSVENAKKLLALKDFRRVIASYADDFDSFKAVQDADQGN